MSYFRQILQYLRRIARRAVHIALCVILKLVTQYSQLQLASCAPPWRVTLTCLRNPTARPYRHHPFPSLSPCPSNARAMIRSSRGPDSLVFQLQEPTWHAKDGDPRPKVFTRVRRYIWIRRPILRVIRSSKALHVDSKHVHNVIIPFPQIHQPSVRVNLPSLKGHRRRILHSLHKI
ncbi:hypothetical protein PILCRDRAFT_821082 [Piloderma croceum F 1598]|uniref:Uncharacterized protein n=1 Tax=Piloderma croceum (strain F 1598) TaxID=765440 RepID=A0A0C3BWJ5_PILCF|nr:hypothetical protein PILCRDRAFT_821082 [Piloderma croceum F 1598]